MDEFIKLLDKDYELVHCQMKDKAIIFHIQSSRKELTCPLCGSKSMRTHSTYERKIQDLPIQEKKVILLVTTRKMFCDNPECQHTTFAEVHPFAAPKILRDLDETKDCRLTHAQIAHIYTACSATVSNLIRDYVNKGVDSIIRYNISPNSAASRRKADGRVEAKLIHIACGPAPDGHSRWTLQLLEEKARMELETPISRETIHRVLKKTNSSLIETITGVSHQRKTRNL